MLEAEDVAVATSGTNYGWRSFAHIWDPPSVCFVEDGDLEKAMEMVEEYSALFPPRLRIRGNALCL